MLQRFDGELQRHVRHRRRSHLCAGHGQGHGERPVSYPQLPFGGAVVATATMRAQ